MGMNGMSMQVGGMHGPPSILQLPQVPDTMRQTDSPINDREKKSKWESPNHSLNCILTS